MRKIAVILCLAFTAPVWAGPPDNLIAYRKVAWRDFRGEPSPLGPEAARIATGIQVESLAVAVEHLEGKRFRAAIRNPIVYSFMDPSASGFRPTGNTPYALAHEQLHFDITEVFARRMLDALEGLSLEGDDQVRIRFDLESRAWDIREGLIREWSATQARYDRESGHGVRKGKQKDWAKRVETWLKETAR